MYQNIPAELRALPQFVNWRYEQLPGAEKPTKPLFDPRSGWKASHSNPNDWTTFETAVSAAATGKYSGVGFVLSANDPYTFIDLDTYDPKLTAEDKERHQKIAHAFQGYAELSPSGAGLHLIIKGKVPAGRKRGGVEIYSAERYMTVTGNVWRDGPIVEQQELLDTLWAELAPAWGNAVLDTHTDEPQTEADHAVCDKAAAAYNGDKFTALWLGNWQQFYPSQSEADFALIDIIAYYTKNRAQIKRIFRMSALGQRDKAKQDRYFDNPNYGMLNRAFDNQVPEVDLSALTARVNSMLEQQAQPAPAPTPIPEPENEIYSVPTGLLGEIAQYIYSAAPRQVPEIALCGAIGIMAGICGRAYNISGTGLNQYLMLLAPTGSGKEAMASGISNLLLEVQKAVPSAHDFIGPGEIRSDAALLKYIAKKSPSFLTIGGEFGHTLEQMSSINGSSTVKGIKRVMLDLYGKSGQGAVLRPTIYSDSDKNTLALNSPAFSFIGESAPESFFNSVDEQLVADGMLPRFTLIEYTGKQPTLNGSANHKPKPELVQQVAALCAQCLNLNAAGKVVNIQFQPEAKELLDQFEESCREKINSDDAREVIRHLWNRAHLRALKLAGLLAVGEHPFEPWVSLKAAEWAIRLSAHNTQRLLNRFESGEVGRQTSDDKHVKETRRIITKYLHLTAEQRKKFNDFENKIWFDKVVPYKWIQNNTASLSAFKNSKMGATPALRTALKNLISSGELTEITKMQMHKAYETTSEAYAISDMRGFV